MREYVVMPEYDVLYARLSTPIDDERVQQLVSTLARRFTQRTMTPAEIQQEHARIMADFHQQIGFVGPATQELGAVLLSILLQINDF